MLELFYDAVHWVLCRVFDRHELWTYGPDSDGRLHRACKWCNLDKVH